MQSGFVARHGLAAVMPASGQFVIEAKELAALPTGRKVSQSKISLTVKDLTLEPKERAKPNSILSFGNGKYTVPVGATIIENTQLIDGTGSPLRSQI